MKIYQQIYSHSISWIISWIHESYHSTLNFPLKKLRLNNREGSIQATKAVSSDTSLVEAWGNWEGGRTVWMPNGKSLTGSGAPEAYVVPWVEWRYMDLKLMDFAFHQWACRASICGGKRPCWGLATLPTCDPWRKDVMFDHHIILTSFADRIVVIYNCNARNTWMKHHKALLNDCPFGPEDKVNSPWSSKSMPRCRSNERRTLSLLDNWNPKVRQPDAELKLWMVQLIQMIHTSKILE